MKDIITSQKAPSLILGSTHGRAFRLSDIKSEEAMRRTWQHVVKEDATLLRHVRLGQRTMRLAKMIPNWHAFMQTEYYRQMQRALTTVEMKRYRAAWELVFTVCEPPDNVVPLRLAVHYMIRHALRKSYGKELKVNPGQFGIDDAQAAGIAAAAEEAYSAMYPNGSPDIALAMKESER